MRKRNSEATKESILAVATNQFATQGYTATGVRSIASEAGCDPALIGRYFGSKEGLYRAVLDNVSQPMSLERLSVAPRDLWPRLLAETMFLPESRIASMLYVRSASNPEIAPIFQERIAHTLVEPLAALIGEDGRRRAEAINAVLIGYATNELLLNGNNPDADHTACIQDASALIAFLLSSQFV